MTPGAAGEGSWTTVGGPGGSALDEMGRLWAVPAQMAGWRALMVYGTSHHALKDRAALKSGETLLMLGAAGGVGLAAVQIGKVLGARVIAAASTDQSRRTWRGGKG